MWHKAASLCSCSWLVRLLSTADVTDPTMTVQIICMVKMILPERIVVLQAHQEGALLAMKLRLRVKILVLSGSSSSSPLEYDTQIGKLKYLKAAAFPGRYYRTLAKEGPLRNVGPPPTLGSISC